MREGIFICGLNGCGKSTLGRLLADTINYKYIDMEECYFPNKDIDYAYDNACSRTEAQGILIDKLSKCGDFVLTSVMGDKFSDEILRLITWVIVINAPKEIRIKRVKERSYKQFGDRILLGGDLYDREERFFDIVKSKSENSVDEWVGTMDCNTMRIDGTKPIDESVGNILELLGASIDSFA